MSLSTKDIFKPGLGRKFVILVVFFSLATTLVTTATQLYLEYDREISRVQKTVDQIPKIYLRGLAAYLGRGDGDGVRLLLAGIIELPNFVYVGVTGNDGKEISIGDITSETVISKTFPLMYSDGGRDRSIGALRVAADPGLVYRQLIERAGAILLGNGLKTFFVSGFVLVIFYFLIARHLFHIAGFVAGLRPMEAGEPLSLKRKRGNNKPEDELDLVVGAVNRFSTKPGETTRDRSEGGGELSLLFENVEDSIFIVDPQSARILDANNKAVERLGYTKEELLRLSVGNLHDPENPPCVKNILAELREKGSRVTKLTHVGKDGSAMPVEITSRLIDYGGRQVIQSIARDITERARAEELLRASEKRFRGLIENSVQPQVVLQRLKPIFVNQAFVDQFRFGSREEVLAMADLTQTMFPQDVSAFSHESFDDFGGGIARPVVERVVLRADGSQFPAEIFLELVDWDESPAVLVTYCDISEKNWAKAALVENEERLRMILAAGKAGAWSWDLATNKNLWSDENFHLLGYAPGEIEPSYDAWFSRIHQEDRDFCEKQVAKAVADETELNFEYRAVMPDGTIRWIQDIGNFIKGGFGNPKGMYGIQIDITEKKLADQAIRENEKRLNEAQKIFRLGTWEWKIPADELRWSDEVYRIFGCLPGEVELNAERFLDFVHPDDRGMVEAELAAALKTGSFELEHRIVRPDGQQRVVAEKGKVFYDEKKYPLEIVGTVLDITERIQKEEELVRLATALERTAEGVLITDPRGSIQYVNQAFERITGYAKEEVLGKNPRILKSGKQDREMYKTLWNAITKGEIWNGYLTNRKKDGSTYEEEMSVTPIKDNTGRIINFIAVKRDITARKKADELIESQQKLLIQADKMASLGILVSGMAHEINNPNAIIALNTPSLAEFWKDALPVLDAHHASNDDFSLASIPYRRVREDIPAMLEDIQGGADRIKTIVENLKNFARRGGSGERSAISLNKVVESAAVLVGANIRKATNHFQLAFADNMPLVEANFQELEQVVINLLTNSCDALADPEKGITVSTRFDPKSQQAFIIVADEGDGIAQENLGRIKDPFFTTKRESGGTGLGLSVSHGIIDDHNGSLEFSSSPEGGTTATIALPLRIG